MKISDRIVDGGIFKFRRLLTGGGRHYMDAFYMEVGVKIDTNAGNSYYLSNLTKPRRANLSVLLANLSVLLVNLYVLIVKIDVNFHANFRIKCVHEMSYTGGLTTGGQLSAHRLILHKPLI